MHNSVTLNSPSRRRQSPFIDCRGSIDISEDSVLNLTVKLVAGHAAAGVDTSTDAIR